jgi:hypothetical protein
MRILLAAVALSALNAPAVAAPWANNQIDYDDSGSAYIAYQFSEKTDDYVLVYECDSEWQLDSITVESPETYDATASYASLVPTQFIVDDGTPVEMNGVVREYFGRVAVFYDSFDAWEEFARVLNAVQGAKTSIRVKFLEHDVTFSADGVREATTQASAPCY